MYKITLTKYNQVLFHTEEKVGLEVVIIIMIGVREYNDSTLNLHVDKYLGDKIDEDFSLKDFDL